MGLWWPSTNKELRAEHLFGNRSLLLDQLLSHLPRRHGEIADSRIATSHEVRQSCFSNIPIPDPIQPPCTRFRLAVRTWDQIAQNVATVHLLECEVIGKRLEQIAAGLAFGNDPAPCHIAGVARLHLGKQLQADKRTRAIRANEQVAFDLSAFRKMSSHLSFRALK